MALLYQPHRGRYVVITTKIKFFERVDFFATLLDGNAVRSKIKDFRTALYPRQYHPSALEKPLNKRFFAYKVFFRRACQRKNEKCGVNAAKIEFGVYRQTECREFILCPQSFLSMKKYIKHIAYAMRFGV